MWQSVWCCFIHENCMCRKKLVAPLIEECTGTVEEVKLAKITLPDNENNCKCNPAQCKLCWWY